MKKLLADFLVIKEEDIEGYYFDGTHSLSISSERDFGMSYSIIEGEVNQPHYKVTTYLKERYYWVSLEELLVFIYNK